MISQYKSLLLAVCLACLTSRSIAQFFDVGSGTCVDESGFSYDFLQSTGVSSSSTCQSRCTSIDTTNLRGLQHSGTTCNCLYENGAGIPADAFSEFGTEPGNGAVASVNATFATFICYSYSGSWTRLGTGGCVDNSGDFYSYAVPFNARGSQTLDTCQSACTSAGTGGLVGLDYDGECYCLYTFGRAPSVAFTDSVSSNSGSGAIGTAGTGTGSCMRFGRVATPVAVPVAVPVVVPVATVPVVVPVAAPTVPVAVPTAVTTPTSTNAKAPRVKGAGKKKGDKGPGKKGTKLVASPVTPVAKAPRNPKRRLKVDNLKWR